MNRSTFAHTCLRIVLYVSAMIGSSGLWRRSYQVLLRVAGASGGLFESQHGSGHTSAVPSPKRGRDGRGARLVQTDEHWSLGWSNLVVQSEPFIIPLPAESYNLPPQLPPRIINEVKDSEPKCPEHSCKSFQDTYLMRLQHMDLSA